MRDMLRTEQLDLRLFDEPDVPELHDIFADPLTNTIGSGPFSSLDQTRGWVQRRQQLYTEHGLAWYAVLHRETGRLLGNCGMLPGRTGIGEPAERLGMCIDHTDTDPKGELLFYTVALA